MYGAIIGDIIGSRFEFDRGSKSREFSLFTKACEFTDDTVMTAAVAEALLDAGRDADGKTVKSNLIRSMKKWGQKYPHAGYGARFINWVLTDDPEPYGSFGNGSAMRVSPAGWLYDTIERTREVAGGLLRYHTTILKASRERSPQLLRSSWQGMVRLKKR